MHTRLLLCSSLPGSLTGSRLSLTEGEETEVQAESDDHDLEGQWVQYNSIVLETTVRTCN